MSHFLKSKLKIEDKNLLNQVASSFGWNVEEISNYRNPYGSDVLAKGFRIFDPLIFGDRSTRLLVSDTGEVITDNYYMGDKHLDFTQQYSKELLIQTGFNQGMTLGSESVDENGDILLEMEVFNG